MAKAGLAALAACSISARALAAEAEMAWDPVSDATGYKVYYDTDSGAPYGGTQANEGPSPIDVPLSALADPTKPVATLTGLPSCTVFYFAVTAYNTAGESDFSGEVSATVIARPQPVTASAAGDGEIALGWPTLPSDDSGAVPRYFLHYDTQSHASFKPPDPSPYAASGSPVKVETSALTNPQVPAWVLGGLQSGTTHYLRVEAQCDDGKGKYSDEVSSASGTAGGGSGGGTASGGSSSGGAGGVGGAGVGGEPSGGTSPGTGGAGALPATGGAASGADDSGEASGCGCALPGSAPGGSAALLSAVALIGLVGRRRRGG